jgi:hypothetical protein
MHDVIDIRARTAENVRAHQLHGRPNAHGWIQSRFDLTELEFSEYGRDPRFLPGWWIVPMCFIPLIVWICLIA